VISRSGDLLGLGVRVCARPCCVGVVSDAFSLSSRSSCRKLFLVEKIWTVLLFLAVCTCVCCVGVISGAFSPSSESSCRRLFLVEKMSMPLLFLAVPVIPLFLGEEDLGGRRGVERVDLRMA